MLITRKSRLTGKERALEIDVTEAQMKAWRSGVMIQRAMPNVSPEDREFILSGITKEEWGAAFNDEKEP